MNDEENFLGVGLILLGMLLALILIPLLIGFGVAFLCGIDGLLFFGVIIGVAVIIWSILGMIYYI